MNKPKTKKKRKLPRSLLNWPPSRGPMPAWMRAKPKYKIPEVEIEAVEMVPDRRRWMKPATEIKRVVPKPAPPKSKKNRRTRSGCVIVIKDLIAEYNAQRELDLRLNTYVATIATLKSPRQWDLIGGAELRPCKGRGSRKPGTPKFYAIVTNFIPERTITIDLSYPLRKIARVTVRPYVRVSSGHKSENMSIGYVLWQLARAYKQIYRRHAFWGVWGHAITDLCFERFTLSDNIGHVSIGS